MWCWQQAKYSRIFFLNHYKLLTFSASELNDCQSASRFGAPKFTNKHMKWTCELTVEKFMISKCMQKYSHSSNAMHCFDSHMVVSVWWFNFCYCICIRMHATNLTALFLSAAAFIFSLCVFMGFSSLSLFSISWMCFFSFQPLNVDR